MKSDGSRAVGDCWVPVRSRWTLHYVALPPLAALDELVAVVVREVELAVRCVFGCARVAAKEFTQMMQDTYTLYVKSFMTFILDVFTSGMN